VSPKFKQADGTVTAIQSAISFVQFSGNYAELEPRQFDRNAVVVPLVNFLHLALKRGPTKEETRNGYKTRNGYNC
jgi:hypothetical protein